MSSTGLDGPQPCSGVAPLDLSCAEYSVTAEDITVETQPFAVRFTPNPEEEERFIEKLQESCKKYSPDDHADEPETWCAVTDAEGNWSRAEILCYYR